MLGLKGSDTKREDRLDNRQNNETGLTPDKNKKKAGLTAGLVLAAAQQQRQSVCATTHTFTSTTTSACGATVTLYSPTVFRGPLGRRT